MPNIPLEETEQVTLCEAIDRILNKGAVIAGEVTISVANIDLIYLGLNLVVTSIVTARELEEKNSISGPPVRLGLGAASANQVEIMEGEHLS